MYYVCIYSVCMYVYIYVCVLCMCTNVLAISSSFILRAGLAGDTAEHQATIESLSALDLNP